MTADLLALAASERTAVEERCAELVAALASEHAPMRAAIEYSLLGGGKRLRPILCLWTHELVGGVDADAALDAGCAVECVHAYSLVHDDLPCMDDDDLRRGKPSAHKRFGEATAVLAGDALLTLAFQILVTIPVRRGVALSNRALEAAKVLAGAAGTGGLIAGQALDLEAESGHGDTAAVERIHENKTARLIAAAMEIGAVVGGAAAAARDAVRRSGTGAGMAFQIFDDVLDLETDEETLGKTPGKDVKSGKLTYTSVAGVAGARARAGALIEQAKAQLPDGPGAAKISALFDFFVTRTA